MNEPILDYDPQKPKGVYVVPDAVVFPPTNSSRRVLFLVACPLCKNDFDVRDGRWVPVKFPSGRTVQLKVCDNCAKDETPANSGG
jgi:hypothetical protein